MTEIELKPIVEALIYLAEEPLTESALVDILGPEHKDLIKPIILGLIQEYQLPEHGVEVKEVANGYKMATKPEHHEWARKYVKHQNPPTKLSLAALETLAVIAYKQPVTVPEVQEIRGVNAVGVLKTLIEKRLVTTAGRKNVIGRPILYRTTKEFLLHFGLKSLDELPSLEEFEELAQSALGNDFHEMPGDTQPLADRTTPFSGPAEVVPQSETEPNPATPLEAGVPVDLRTSLAHEDEEPANRSAQSK
jgi:segregation and condensation protein B